MRNAANIMEAVDVSGKYDMGRILLDHLIAGCIPRQIVGAEFKASLMSGTTPASLAEEYSNFHLLTGSCNTGIAEAYYSFSFFGSIIFAFIGFIIRKLWEGCMNGEMLYQLIYTQIIGVTIATFNATLFSFIGPWLQMIIFLGPFMIYSHVRDRSTVNINDKSNP
jgi:hypothetical protein